MDQRNSTKKPKEHKELKNKHDRLAYVLRGKNRREIYQLLLISSFTLSEISMNTRIYVTNA
ncbi:MAG: hypothetical protein ACFE9L_10160 [Candidatus Hodarchaeota archaeon]